MTVNILPVPVKVGDIILMDKYAGQEVTVDDEEYIILKADDIIAIIERLRRINHGSKKYQI